MLFFKQCPVSYNTPYEKIGDEVRSLADEVLFDIPDSWEWVRLIDVCEYIQRGKSPKYSPIKKYPVVAQKCNQWSGFSIEKAQFIEPNSLSSYGPERLLQDNDLMWNSTGLGTLGRMAIYKTAANPYELAVADSHVTVIRPLKQFVLPEYLYYYFANPSVQSVIEDQADGTTKQKELATATIKAYLTPIPPLDEQRRILAKLSEVLPVVKNYGVVYDETTVMQEAFPESLKKSILQEAVQGKLVPQDPSDEPAEALLERIRVEKQRLIKEGKIKKNKHESVIFRRDNSHYEKRGSKEENINDIIPFELPDSWEWIRLSAILTSTDAGKSPQCENRPRTIGEWGVIKTTAIQDGYFLAEENKVLPLDFDLQESMVVHHGDLLITRAGPRNRTGVICVVDGEPENLILSDKTVRLSYLRNFVNPHYVMTALSSPAMQYFVVDAMTGMASSQVNISQEKMKTFLLPLPPLNEQQRIVDEVSKIFGRIDKLNF